MDTKQAKFQRAVEYWGTRAVQHLDQMQRLLELGRDGEAEYAATAARSAAVYAATAARVGDWLQDIGGGR